MKNLIIALSIILVGAGILTTVPCGKYALAVAGCCKERPTENHAWRRSAKNFDQCVNANKSEGGDIFQPVGIVWWDIGC